MKLLAEVSVGEIATITMSRETGSNLPPYDCIGGNMDYPTRTPGFQNLYSIIQDMSKQTAWVWWELVKNRNRYTNEVSYTAKTRVEINRLSVAYKELSRLDLVHRIRKQHYLINPLALLPEHKQFQVVYEKWQALKSTAFQRLSASPPALSPSSSRLASGGASHEELFK